MKRSKIQRVMALFCLLAAGIFCSSCQKEATEVYDQLLGEWVITGVNQAQPMTLEFAWDMGLFFCHVHGTEAGKTPDLGNGDGSYTVKAYLEKENGVQLQFTHRVPGDNGSIQHCTTTCLYASQGQDIFTLTPEGGSTYTFNKR